MVLGAEARVLLRLSAWLLLVAAVATGWEVLASQSPSSPYHFGILPGPVGELRSTATVLGILTLGLAWLLPHISASGPPRILVGLLCVGSAITIAALTYGSTQGMYGLQIEDPRPDSRWLFWIRAIGYLVLFVCLVDVARRVFRRGFGTTSS